MKLTIVLDGQPIRRSDFEDAEPRQYAPHRKYQGGRHMKRMNLVICLFLAFISTSIAIPTIAIGDGTTFGHIPLKQGDSVRVDRRSGTFSGSGYIVKDVSDLSKIVLPQTGATKRTIECQFPRGYVEVRKLEDVPKSFPSMRAVEQELGGQMQKPVTCHFYDDKGKLIDTKEGKASAQLLDEKGDPQWRVEFSDGQHLLVPTPR